MSDKRYFAKIDVGYLDNPKIADLVDAHKDAVLLHLRAILYCRQHLTDGVFPIAQVVRLAAASYCGDPSGVQCTVHSTMQCSFCICMQTGLFEPEDGRHAAVHDYLEHQESA